MTHFDICLFSLNSLSDLLRTFSPVIDLDILPTDFLSVTYHTLTGAEEREGRGLLANIEILCFISEENKSYL